MNIVTGEDRVIGLVFVAALALIFGVVVAGVLAAWRDRRAHAAMDVAQDALRWRWGTQLLHGVVARRSIAPVSHRARWQVPAWLRTLAAHGQARESKRYGPPPPLAVVEEPTVTAWSARDRNTVPSLLNPAVGAARVPRRDSWEELDVIGDVLGGRMRAAANSEDTGLIEPIRAEVVQ